MIIVYLPFGNFYFPSFPSSEMWSFHLGFFFFLSPPPPPCHLRGKPVGKRGAARGNVTFGSAANPQASTHELTRGFSSVCSGTYGYITEVWDLRGREGCLGDRRGLTMVRAFTLPLSSALATCDKSAIVAVFISTPSGVWLTHTSSPDGARPLVFWIRSQASMRRLREVS